MEEKIIRIMEEHGERLCKIEALLSISKAVLNLDEVSQLTGLSKSHIYKLTSQSKIPHYKQSKHLYFDRIEIENWLKSSRRMSAEDSKLLAMKYVILNKGRREK